MMTTAALFGQTSDNKVYTSVVYYEGKMEVNPPNETKSLTHVLDHITAKNVKAGALLVAFQGLEFYVEYLPGHKRYEISATHIDAEWASAGTIKEVRTLIKNEIHACLYADTSLRL